MNDSNNEIMYGEQVYHNILQNCSDTCTMFHIIYSCEFKRYVNIHNYMQPSESYLPLLSKRT